MKSTAKADVQFLVQLKDQLKFRTQGSATIDTIREARDAEGYPMLFLSDAGSEVAGASVIALRMRQIDGVSKDVFGNTNLAYTPHTIEIAYELTAGGAPTPSALDIAKVQLEVFKLGVKVEVKQIANTTAVTESSINAKSADISLDYDVRWPSKGI